MNKELAKTLTTALVQFIDREIPEGTMCCSNIDCERLETSFEVLNLAFIEKFIKSKLLGSQTEFEQEVSDIVEYCKEHGGSVAFDYAKRHAKSLLALAKKELLKDDVLGREHLEGYIKGRNDALREMSDFMESHFNPKKAREGDDLTDLYYKEYERNPEPIPTGVAYNPSQCGTNVTIAPNTSSGTSTLKAEG